MKKQTRNLFMVLVVLALVTLACSLDLNSIKTVQGEGDLVEETRQVEGFDKIEINGMGEIFVTLGTEEALRVEAEENLLPYLETYVRGSSLVIGIEDGTTIVPTKSLNFYVTVVSLEGLSISGAGNVQLPEIEADRFSIDLSGAGNIDIDSLNADSLDVSMSGLGNLTVSDGQVSSLDVRISGAGKFSAKNLESGDAEITISGLGSATLRAENYLKVTISGGGDVSYYGSPEVDSEISGLGDLDRLGD